MAVTFNQCTSNKEKSGSETKAESTAEIYSVEATEFYDLSQKSIAQLVDVRTPSEYADGHISGAVNMDIYENDFSQKIKELSKDKPVLVYCRSGSRSMKAAEMLEDEGFELIYNLEGGINSWNSAGFETEK